MNLSPDLWLLESDSVITIRTLGVRGAGQAAAAGRKGNPEQGRGNRRQDDQSEKGIHPALEEAENAAFHCSLKEPMKCPFMTRECTTGLDESPYQYQFAELGQSLHGLYSPISLGIYTLFYSIAAGLKSGIPLRELPAFMSGRPRRACGQCHLQKVRCDLSRPNCERCVRLRRSCSYGEGTLTTLPGGASLSVQQAQNHSQSESTDSSPRLLPSSRSSLSLTTAGSDRDPCCIPPSLLRSLVEIFFSHVYNASLLVHKVSFLRDLDAGVVRPQVTLSVCAMGSRFYVDASDRAVLVELGFSIEWAERASKLVLQDADDPHEDNIVALVNLAHFWYSQGAWQRFFLHKCIATQTAEVLGLAFDHRNERTSLESEIRRRRFWACFLINSFSSDAAFPQEPTETVLNLGLPANDLDFDRGISTSGSTLLASQGDGSIFAEMIKAMTHWMAVCALIKNTELPVASRVAALQTLHARISEWWSKLPSSMSLTPKAAGHTPENILPRLIKIHIVYHQTLCALHASIVPIFSWTTSDDTWLYARQVSAQVAFEHANAISSLYDAALQSASWIDGQMPSFIGYAAYAACAIQIPFLWCLNADVQQKAQANVAVNLRMIKHVAKYWKFVALLGSSVRKLYEMHARNPTRIDGEPKNTPPNKLNSCKVTAIRARTSILGHNEILWSKDGAMVRQGKELDDFGLEDISHSMKSSSAAAVDTAMTNSTPAINTQATYSIQSVDASQQYFDTEIFSSDVPFLVFDQTGLNQETGTFEEWLEGFPYQIGTG